jgi:hypothetical protein
MILECRVANVVGRISQFQLLVVINKTMKAKGCQRFVILDSQRNAHLSNNLRCKLSDLIAAFARFS